KIPTSELSGDGWALAPGEEYNGYYIDDYFLYITSANRTIEEKTEIGKEKYYDDDYSVQTRPEKYEYRIHYVIKGKTDPALSGKRIKISEVSILHFGPSETVIQEDGTFKVDGTISLPFNIESYYVFQYLSISIYQ
ncbi:MAG: hypothetical protein IKY00_04825, partial [Clostridia bacterium]|nr:hypothetical protein [Clostridia bacterium]